MDLWNHVICHYYILHLRLSVYCCRSLMCSNRYKYFDHLEQLARVGQFVHPGIGSGPVYNEMNECVYWLNKNGFAVDDISENAEQETSVMRSRKKNSRKDLTEHPLLTWNELFLLNVTIFSTLPKRWNIWCRMSNETGYNSDSTITRRTVFWPPAGVTVWCTPCDIGSVPDIGRGEPDAGDATWKSWLCNATDAF